MATDVAPHNMTASNVPSPFVASASSEYGGYPAWKCFDGNATGTPWCTSSGGSGWLKIDLGSGNEKKVGTYAIGAYGDAANCAPKNWTLEGSNNDSTWDPLDTVANSTGWANPETRAFTCDVVTTAYRYFRLNVTENNGNPWLEINELYLYEYEAPPPSAISNSMMLLF